MGLCDLDCFSVTGWSPRFSDCNLDIGTYLLLGFLDSCSSFSLFVMTGSVVSFLFFVLFPFSISSRSVCSYL